MSGKTGQADHAHFAYRDLVEQGLDGQWQVVVADENHLQIDYDSPIVPISLFMQGLGLLEKRLGGKPIDYKVTNSKSGNKHVIITLPQGHNLNIFERVGWQAILGSDPLREALHYVDIEKNEKNPILLFEKKEQLLLPAASVCTVCQTNPVTPEDGQDTCEECIGKI